MQTTQEEIFPTVNNDTHLERRILCMSPVILTINNFLSDYECDHLIEISREQMSKSLVLDPATGHGVQDQIRTSSHCWISYRQDSIVGEIEDRIAHLTSIPSENGEQLSVLNYEKGQEYGAHHDYFDPDYQGSEKVLLTGGQRVCTVLLYLSNVEEGGETYFPIVNVKVVPRKGTLVYFTNVYSDQSVDPNSLHAGMPVIKGEKWLATKWLRANAYR